MSSAPVALFCYNRLDTLQETLSALKANKLSAESDLYIFSDGAKGEKDREKVEQVRAFIKDVTGFKSVTVRAAEKNRGLANSIISGVTEIVNSYGKIIVLEDDIVTAPFFLEWMNSALDLYENNEKVAGIHAWSPPAEFGARPETFFIREVGCWGWATWKRGWDLFEADGSKLLKEFNTRKMIADFNVYGSYPYYGMLKNQVAGRVDSWAIRWYASVFLKGKLGLQPGRSLVVNVGCQTGTHCEGADYIPQGKLPSVAPELKEIPEVCAHEVLEKVFTSYNTLAHAPSLPRLLVSCMDPGGMADLKRRLMRKIKALKEKSTKLLTGLLPVAVVEKLREKRKCWGYRDLCPTLEEAVAKAGTYAELSISRKVTEAAQQVIKGLACYERDGVLFYEKERNYRLVSALLQAAMKTNELHVLDFGGALGSTFWQNREVLEKAVKDFSWHIVEQKSFYDAAAQLKYDAPLYFHETIEEALKNQKFNAVLFSSVLQYLETPECFLEKVADIPFLIVDLHPEFVSRTAPGYAVQYVKEPIYNASYPLRIWGKDELRKTLLANYGIIDEWVCSEAGIQRICDGDGKVFEVRDVGMCLKRKGAN